MSYSSVWKPMLAASEIPKAEDISFPCMASFKLDGIRSPLIAGKAMSRKLIPLPNKFYQSWVAANAAPLEGIDCEVIVGPSTGEGVFNRTSSAIMSAGGTPDFKIYVFDAFAPGMTLDASTRYHALMDWHSELTDSLSSRVVLLEQRLLQSIADVKAYMQEAMGSGYEGLVLKKLNGLYKNGRSTVSEGLLLKWKEFEYEECRILSVVQGQTNNNVLGKDALGNAKRSRAKAGMALIESVGGFEVQDVKTGVKFTCGTGVLKAVDCTELWAIREHLIGRIFTYKFQPYGVLNKPRYPGFHGWKNLMDMETPKY